MRVSGRYSLRLALLVFTTISLTTMFAQAPPLRFAQPISYEWARQDWVAAADLNGDRRLDLVTVSSYEGKVGVLLGKGDGTFRRVVKYSTGGRSPYVAIADVNQDGKPDILVSDRTTVGVLLGYGNGSFQPVVTYAADNAGLLAVGDLNGDGYPDVAFASGVCPDAICWADQGWCSCVGVLYNDGHGRFGAPIIHSDGGGGSSYTVAIASGSLISTTNCSNPWCEESGVLWYWGNVCCGGNCYDSGGEGPYGMTTGDLNGDGYFDVVVANFGADGYSGLGVLLGNVYGGFQPVVTYPFAYPSYVAVGDVNGDGKPDIVVDGTGVLRGNGNGTFQTAVIFPWVGYNHVLGDVNGDGKLDVIGTYGILLNTSGFATTTRITSSLNPSFVHQSVTFTATVRSLHGRIPDGEPVRFYSGTRLLATVPLLAGTATYTTPTLSVEAHRMTVKYLGDTTYAPSSGGMLQVVQ